MDKGAEFLQKLLEKAENMSIDEYNALFERAEKNLYDEDTDWKLVIGMPAKYKNGEVSEGDIVIIPYRDLMEILEGEDGEE